MSSRQDIGKYPHFSRAEVNKRRQSLEILMDDVGVDHLVVYGANRAGTAVQWISEWPVTQEAALVITPGERDILLVQHYNHLPNARRIAELADVRWGGPSTIECLAALLNKQGGRPRVGVIGPLRFADYQQLAAKTGEVLALDEEYARLRLVKSAEEIDRLQFAARLTDAALEAVAAGVEPGMDERSLAALAESAYLAKGATNHIHYFAVTSMDDPQICVPAQFQSDRRIQDGDMLFCEISASYWGYAGQVLRTFSIGAEPNALFTRLYETAQSAFESITAVIRPGVLVRELVDASSVIEANGFSTYDDLVHGYGGGYLPPVLRSASQAHRPIPEMELEAGMALVVQPNVITTDEKAGVQTGELGVVTENGWESLHAFSKRLQTI